MGNQAHGHSRNCLNSAWRTRLQGGPRKGCPSLQKKGLKEERAESAGKEHNS